MYFTDGNGHNSKTDPALFGLSLSFRSDSGASVLGDIVITNLDLACLDPIMAIDVKWHDASAGIDRTRTEYIRKLRVNWIGVENLPYCNWGKYADHPNTVNWP